MVLRPLFLRKIQQLAHVLSTSNREADSHQGNGNIKIQTRKPAEKITLSIIVSSSMFRESVPQRWSGMIVIISTPDSSRCLRSCLPSALFGQRIMLILVQWSFSCHDPLCITCGRLHNARRIKMASQIKQTNRNSLNTLTKQTNKQITKNPQGTAETKHLKLLGLYYNDLNSSDRTDENTLANRDNAFPNTQNLIFKLIVKNQILA